MEHTKNFANLAENYAAKFSDLDKFYLYIHILGYVSGFDQPTRFLSHDSAPIHCLFTFDKDTLTKIEKFFPFSVNQLSEKEKKDLCSHFLEICLQFERQIEIAPKNPAKFFNDLSVTDPQAVSKNNGDYLISHSELSAQSQKQFIDWDIERYFYYKTPRIPKRINEKIVALADPKGGQNIYDPNCGDGSLFVEFYNKFPDAGFTFNGVVGNQFERLFCLVNFYVNGILDDKRIEFEIEVSSPLQDTPQWYYELKSGENYSLREIASVAVSFVPFKGKSNDGELDSRFFGLSYSLEQPEYAYIELMLNAVRDTGKAIAIVPDSVLYSSEGRFFREAYLSRDWIESVISLDKVDFNLDTFADASIVVFNKHKPNKDIVSFKGELGNTEVKTSIIKSEYDSCLKVTFFLDVKKQLEYIAEAFSAKFPDLAPFRYLYILAGLTGNFLDEQFLSFFPANLLSKFFSRDLISIFTQDQTKEAIEYLVSRIFDSLNTIFPLSHRSWDEIIDDLANQEPDAVQIETTSSGEKIESIDWNKLSYSALNEFTQREIHSALQNPYYLFPSKELERTLVKLAAPKTEQIIYNPNCGVGSIFVEFEKQYPNHNLKYYGVLSDKFSELLCNANLYINGINAEINSEGLYNQTLSFNEELSIVEGVESDNISFYDEDSSEWQDTNIVDIAIGIPAFTERVYLGKYKPLEMLSLKELTRNEYALVEEMLSRLNETGKAIVVVPNSFLFSSHGKSYRQKYLSLDLIEKVISLPDDTFKSQGSIKTSIVVFNKNKSNKNIILFDGKEDRFEKTQIRVNSIISENKTDLSPTRYALKEGKELRNIFADTQYPVKKIKDLVVSSILGRNYPQNLITNGNGSNGKVSFVRVSELSKIGEDFNLDISKIERKISREKVPQKQVIDFDVVLVNLIGNKLKPTYFKFEGKSIVIGSDVIALKMNEDINVEYFLTQLLERLVQIQVEMFSSGTIINRISKEDFLNIQILLPSLKEQTEQTIEFLKKTQKELIEDVAEVEKEVKNTEYDVIRIAIHDFNQKLGAMQNDLSDLKKFFEEKLPNYLSEPIKPVFDDDTEEEINQFRLGNVLQRLINTRNEALAQLSATREEVQNNTVKPALIKNLKKWFEKDVKPLYQHDIDFEVSGEKVEVEIDPNRFKTLVRNLIVNAKQHNAKIVAFDISYSYLDGEKKVRILYKNNGEPFPEDFDFDVHFKGLYQKSSKSKGTGIGGYSVNKTVELHNGEIKNVSPEKNLSDLFPVQIEIILPIEYKPNPNYVKSNPYSLN